MLWIKLRPFTKRPWLNSSNFTYFVKRMAKKPHILIISSWYPSSENANLGNFVQRQASLLAKEYRVTVLNTIGDSNCKTFIVNEETSSDFKEIVVIHPRSNSPFIRKKQEREALKKGLNIISQVDLVIGNVALSKARQFIRAKKHFNCPLIYIEHGSYFRKEKKKDWSILNRFLFKSLIKNSNKIVAVSEVLKNDMLAYCNSEIEVIGNHIDENLFSLKDKKKNRTTRFLHVSTLDPATKNPQGIIDSCLALHKKGLEFNLTIICDTDYSIWKIKAHESGLENVIQFVGPIEWKETVNYYHQSDAFLLFSNYETFSIVLLEALMTGTPVITTKVGIAHNFKKNHGIIVETKNDLTEAMEQFIKAGFTYSPNALREFGMQYSEEAILSKWKTLIEPHVR